MADRLRGFEVSSVHRAGLFELRIQRAIALAAGVGVATTNTVVHSIVSIIFTDLLFTMVFYKLGWT